MTERPGPSRPGAGRVAGERGARRGRVPHRADAAPLRRRAPPLAYYVPQPLEDAVKQARTSVTELQDPTRRLWLRHFLVAASDLLALYSVRRHLRDRPIRSADASWSPPGGSPSGIPERQPPRDRHRPAAVQIAAAALWLGAARQDLPPEALRPGASGWWPSQPPPGGPPGRTTRPWSARAAVERETGIPAKLTDTVIQALAGAGPPRELSAGRRGRRGELREHEAEACLAGPRQSRETSSNGGFGLRAAREPGSPRRRPARRSADRASWRSSCAHTHGDDLGLRLRGAARGGGSLWCGMIGEELRPGGRGIRPTRGPRRWRMRAMCRRLRAGQGGPYAAFIERGLQLVRKGGVSGAADDAELDVHRAVRGAAAEAVCYRPAGAWGLRHRRSSMTCPTTS